jgi:arylsulfatase A-like enzyme
MTGDHRLAAGKGVPYEEADRVPLYVRGPGVAPGSRIGRIVGNADLGPTFAAWGGTSLPGADGRSLVPLLANPAASWRHAYPLFYLRGADGPNLPGWRGVRTDRYTYVEYDTGERELYDMAADPNQLTNIAATATPALVAQLAARTTDLAGCAGATCRAAENAPLP